LNADGKPDENGRIVLISIGMSNTTQEFQTFIQLANSDPDKNPKLVLVDGALSGMIAERIVDLSTGSAQRFWDHLDTQLSAAGVTPAQVQVAWLKQVRPRRRGDFIDRTVKLKECLAALAQILHTRFPNIRLAYYSSRIYGGYASIDLNPEPFAYESGFGVKWLVEDQINGSRSLNFDPSRGEVKAPWIGWGPYLWADGLTPRSDGLTYSCSDFESDGTHPARGAQDKVAKMLLHFLKTDGTARLWFLRSNDPTPSDAFFTAPQAASTRTGRQLEPSLLFRSANESRNKTSSPINLDPLLRMPKSCFQIPSCYP
jgi:hypothetical protein